MYSREWSLVQDQKLHGWLQSLRLAWPQARTPFPNIMTRVQVSKKIPKHLLQYSKKWRIFLIKTVMNPPSLIPMGYYWESYLKYRVCSWREGIATFNPERLESQAVSFYEPIKKKKLCSQQQTHWNKCAVSMWTPQKMTCTYLSSSASHCKPEKAMSTVLNLPTLLSKNGGQKSDLVSYLQTDSPSDYGEADVKLIDDANVFHSLGSDLLLQ